MKLEIDSENEFDMSNLIISLKLEKSTTGSSLITGENLHLIIEDSKLSQN